MAISTISIGKVKFNWRGDWTATTTYAKDDVVKYGPNAYTCLTAHTSGSTFAPDVAKWDLMVAGLENAGTWNSSTLYKYGQTVTYGGAVYIALRENTSSNPYVNALDWQKFVDGQQFEGEYNTGVTYQKGDIVYYGGYLYVAKQNATNNNPTDDTYWDVYVKGYEFLGTYNNATQYKPGDVVSYGGNRYAVKQGERPLNVLPTNSISWVKILDGLNWRGEWSSLNVYAPNDLTKHGGKVYRCIDTTEDNAPEVNPNFELFVDGQQWRGNWDSGENYYAGDIVKFGARNYICLDSHDGDSSTATQPPNTEYWGLYSDGLQWAGVYSASADYQYGDVVEYSQSSYVCISDDVSGVTPGTDPDKWNLVAQGDISSPMTTTGDLIYRNASGNVERLGIGPSGSFLTVNNGIPAWGHLTPQNDYYVSPQGNDSNDGRTTTTSWRTIRHACEQTFNLGLARINVSAGSYEEQCPIRVGRGIVLEGNGLGAVTVSPNTSRDEGFGVGISDDGSTPNANSYVFHMNNGARMRNFVFRNFSTGSVLVSLDPGYGPDDTSVWITSQSPYVQNCTSFTPGGTGFKIDGSLHNGGYKSMVANDWTQINSDGIGIHALNDGRTEIVSCFTYYCNIGYLAESGAKIRAIVGNNSYGEYGAVARGFSQLETPLVGKLRLTDQTINSVQTLSSNIHVFTSYRDSVGNRFFVGHTAPTLGSVNSTWSNSSSYPIIAKFNSAGSLDWLYSYETTYGAIHSAVELSDRIYCGGVIYDGGSNKGFILSISKAGEIQWQKTIGDTIEIIDLTTDGDNLYAVGDHVTAGVSVIKLNPAGIEQWSRTLQYNDSSVAGTLTATSCCFADSPTTSIDTYALAGDATAEDNLYVSSYDSTVNQTVVSRITSTGAFNGSYQYGDVKINKLRLDTGNGDGIYLMAAGWYDPAGGVSKRPLAFRLNVKGEVQWQSELVPVTADDGEFKDVLPFGNDVYLTGYLNDTNNAGLISRYTSAGSNVWNSKITNGSNNIALNGIMLDGVNVICAGLEGTNSLIVSVQRDQANGIGTVTSGSYIFDASPSYGSTSGSTVQMSINAIDMNSIALGTTNTSLSLNQTPSQTRTIVATREGFAGIGTGVLFSVDELDRSPKEGSVLQIDGDSETYFVIGVSNFIAGDSTNAGTCQIQVDPAIPSNKTPNDQTTLTFREAFSQVRMSGHDFLDIGTGGFADTNYPVIIASDYVQQPDQNRETLAEAGGRVFYVTTDQDGNFRVGDYFKVEQATGRATLSSEEFDLAGLNELQLGSITAGKQGATINEFSTDGTFADNSDTAVPTEKATKTYVDTKIAIAVAGAGAIVAGTAPNQSTVEVNGTGVSGDTIDFNIAGSQVAQIAAQYFLVPQGTTAERPVTPAEGQIRYNTDVNALEIYQGTAWVPAGGLSNVNVSTAESPYAASAFQYLWIDTSGGAVTVNLPASAQQGDEIRIIDTTGNFSTNNLTVGRNGHNIQGSASDLTVSTDRAGFALVYYNVSQGWLLKDR